MPDTQRVPELKSCPFCACKECRCYQSEVSDQWYVVCSGCYAKTDNVNSRNDAIAAWNRRADAEQREKVLLEALEKVTGILDRVVVGGSKYGWYEAVKQARAAIAQVKG